MPIGPKPPRLSSTPLPQGFSDSGVSWVYLWIRVKNNSVSIYLRSGRPYTPVLGKVAHTKQSLPAIEAYVGL